MPTDPLAAPPPFALPVRCERGPGNYYHMLIVDSEGDGVTDTGDDESSAYIVEAVNRAGELVRENERLRREVRKIASICEQAEGEWRINEVRRIGEMLSAALGET